MRLKMIGLHGRVGDIERFLARRDGNVKEVHVRSRVVHIDFQYQTPEDRIGHQKFDITKEHTEFRIDSLDKILRLQGLYTLSRGERVRVFDAQSFRGDDQGIVTLEGVMRLEPDGTEKPEETYLVE